MGRKLKILLLIFLIGVIVAEGNLLIQKIGYTRCDQPVAYKVGTIDPRFRVSSEELLSDIKSAGEIWNKKAGKPLFVADPRAKLTISLVYDERQLISDKVGSLETQLKTQRGSLDPEIRQYELLVSDFKKRLADFNTKVDYWNGRGGAPPDEYSKLTAEQTELKSLSEKLNSMAQSLNRSVQNYNFNISGFNQSLNTLKTVFDQKPEEGIYRGDLEEIDIYLTSNKNELIHTLAHELGHSIGLSHNEDEKSIMYTFTSESLKLTENDSQDLANLCHKKTFKEWAKDFTKERGLF